MYTNFIRLNIYNFNPIRKNLDVFRFLPHKFIGSQDNANLELLLTCKQYTNLFQR